VKDPELKADEAAKLRYLRPTEEVKQRVRGGSAGSRCLEKGKRLTVSCIRYTIGPRDFPVSIACQNGPIRPRIPLGTSLKTRSTCQLPYSDTLGMRLQEFNGAIFCSCIRRAVRKMN
jgi:hypothetical protein